MSIREYLAKQDRLALLKKVHLAVVIAVVTIAGFLGFRAWGYNAAANSAAKTIERNEVEIATLGEELERARKISQRHSYTDPPSGHDAVTRFQAAVDLLAREHAAEITDFVAEADLKPFTSAFMHEADSSGWIQIDVNLSIRGTAGAVFGVLTQLQHLEIPTELADIDVDRTGWSAGYAIVTARIAIRVLATG